MNFSDWADSTLIEAEIAADAAAGAEGDDAPPATLAEGEEIPF
jgi:hypothetical protein